MEGTEVIRPPYVGTQGSDAMFDIVQINIALWGMLICSGMEMAGWFQAAF